MGSTSRQLPPGFRFHPTDVELIMYHLKRKVMGKRFHFEAISEVDIYKFAPSDLPDKSCLRTGDLKWFFFCPREKKYSSGGRVNRATEIGYWKTTGKDRPVYYNEEVVGMIKTLIFHLGKAPKGGRTDWVMHEYRLEDGHLAERGDQGAYVLCVIFKKNGHGPKNGAQYGAPFKEEDWDDDEEVDCVEDVPSAGLSTPANVLPSNHDSSVATGNVLPAPVTVLPSNHDSSAATGTYFSESTCLGSSSVSCLSEIVRSHCEVLPPVPSNNVLSRESPQVLGDDIYSMMNMCTEDSTFNENDRNEMLNNLNHDGNAEATPFVDGYDFCIGLEDLNNLAGLRENGYNFSTGQQATLTQDQLLAVDGAQFLELTDLTTPLNISAEAGQSQPNPTDGFFAGYNCFINSASQHISASSQFSPLPERRFSSDTESSHLVNPVAGAQYVSVLGQSSPLVGDFEDNNQLHAVDNTQFLELTDLSTPLNISAEAGQSQHYPTDDLYVGYNCYNSEQSCYPVNPCGAPQHISVSSQFSPLPERRFLSDNESSHLVNPVAGAQYVSMFRQSSPLVGGHYDFEDHEAAFVDKENGAYENTDHGYKGCEAALYNVYNSEELLQLESGLTPLDQDQDQRRGEQRIPFSRLQYMLESIPAHPTSAVENQAPTFGEKRSKGSALLYPYGGSSIRVKAEVTLRSSGCTNDALSGKLEFPSVYCYACDPPRREFGRSVACSNEITFVFLLGMLLVFIWFFVAQSSGCKNWQVGVNLVVS